MSYLRIIAMYFVAAFFFVWQWFCEQPRVISFAYGSSFGVVRQMVRDKEKTKP